MTVDASLEPLGQPEPCGRPRLVLVCARCDHQVAWLIPTPRHRAMVLELAEHAGWRGVTIDPCWCPACARAMAGLATELLVPRRSDKRSFYSPELLAEMRELRAGGALWKEVAEYSAKQTGRRVTPDTVCNLMAYHRGRELKLAKEAQAQAEAHARRWYDIASPSEHFARGAK